MHENARRTILSLDRFSGDNDMKKNLACLSLALVLGLNSAAWSANKAFPSPSTFGPKTGGVFMRKALRSEVSPHTEIFSALTSMGFKFPQKLNIASQELSNLKLLRTRALIDQKQYETQRERYVSQIGQALDDAEISKFLVAKMKDFEKDADSEQATMAQMTANRDALRAIGGNLLFVYMPQAKMNAKTYNSIDKKTQDKWSLLFRAENQRKAAALIPSGAAPEAGTEVITYGDGFKSYDVQLGPRAASVTFTFKIDRKKLESPPEVYPSSQEKQKASSKEIPLTPAAPLANNGDSAVPSPSESNPPVIVGTPIPTTEAGPGSKNKATNQISVGDTVFDVKNSPEYLGTVKKLFDDGTALVNYGWMSFGERLLSTSNLVKQVPQFGGMSVGDKVFRVLGGTGSPATVKKLFADGSAIINQGWFDGDTIASVSELVKPGSQPVSQIGDLRVGDTVFNRNPEYLGTVKKLFADGSALVNYGWMNGDRLLSAFYLVKQVPHFGGMSVGDKVFRIIGGTGSPATVKKLFADGTALVKEGWFFESIAPVSELVKRD